MQMRLDNTMMILDILARGHSDRISINELTKEIGLRYGKGYYNSIYRKIQSLEEEKIITLERIGRSTIPKLNFKNYFLIDLLAMLEIKKKQNLLGKYPELQMPIAQIGAFCKDLHYINSICMIDPERNKKLNRMELLILFKDDSDNNGQHLRTEISKLIGLMHALQSRYNIRIDYLMLNNGEFNELSRSDEMNPLQEMLSERIAFFAPENYWMEIKEMQSKGIRIKTLDKETIPARIPEKDLIYNLARFGYKEFGYAMQPGDNICIEYIITAILQNGDMRMIEAIPVILAKNDGEINYRMLIFLCQKYSLLGELLGLLHGLNELRSTEKTKEAMSILEDIGMPPKEIIKKASIAGKMKLYNAL